MKKHSLRKRPGLFAGYASLFLLSGCLGGTGTSTDNGIDSNFAESGTAIDFRDPDGKAVPGLRVQIFGADFNPAREPAPSPGEIFSRAGDRVSPLVTDSLGALPSLVFHQPGTYVVTAENGNGVVAMDTLRIRNISDRAVLHLAIETPAPTAGKIRLESDLILDSGWLVVLGTRYSSRVDSGGRYDLGKMPPRLANRARLLLDKYHSRPLGVSNGTLVHPNAVDTVSTSVPISAVIDTVLVYHTESRSTVQSDAPSIEAKKCSGTGPKDSAVCTSEGQLNVDTTGQSDISGALPDTIGDKDAYLANGLKLSACTAGVAVKSSDDLVISGGENAMDITVLDLSQEPECLE